MTIALILVITVAVLELARRNAARLGLVAYPGAHRHHSKPTPLVGGLGLFAGLLSGAFLQPLPHDWTVVLVLSGFLLVSIGVWDDRHEISFKARFVAQALAVAILAWFADVSLQDLGFLFGTSHTLALGRWGVALTIFAAVGVINAVNMTDGLDGLAGSLSLVTCCGLLAASFLTGTNEYVPFISIVMVALVGFMMYNARIPGLGAARLYLGDAGSLLLGFVLAWLLIAATQGDTRIMAPVTALWIFALPLFDTVSALLRRPLQGRSPFRADRSHYHHYLREAGLSAGQTLIVSVLIGGLFAAAGLYAELRGVPEHLMFYGFLGVFAAFFVSTWIIGARFEKRRSDVGRSEQPLPHPGARAGQEATPH